MESYEIFCIENNLNPVEDSSHAVEYHFWVSKKIDSMIEKIIELTTINTHFKCEISKSEVSPSKYLNIGIMDEDNIQLEDYITIRFSDHKTPRSCYSSPLWSWKIGDKEDEIWIFNEFIKGLDL